MLIASALVVLSGKKDGCYLLIKYFDLVYMKGVKCVKTRSPDFQTTILSNAQIQETHVQNTFKNYEVLPRFIVLTSS